MDTNAYIEAEDAKWRKLEEVDSMAKQKGTLTGRYIRESHADGFAVYVIVMEGKNTVKIKSVDIYDGYQVPYWGDEATIKKSYAVENIAFRDNMEKFLKQSNSEVEKVK